MSESRSAVSRNNVADCSPATYARLARRDRQAIRTENLDHETLDAILNAEIPDGAERLNVLLAETYPARAAPADAGDHR